ncbi:MAG: IS1096 element passenger TnpR family protein [Bacteroidota bacterium]
MIYKFRIISSENEEFIREVAINSHATFFDLHMFLVDELHYDSSQMTSFFLTDQNWNKETEVTLIDMTDGLDSDIKVMDKINLGELITEKKQRLLYVFDQFAERSLFLELFEINNGELPHTQCIRKEGTPPVQLDSSAMESGDLEDIDPDEFLNEEDLKHFSEDHRDLNSYDEEDWY